MTNLVTHSGPKFRRRVAIASDLPVSETNRLQSNLPSVKI